MCADDCGVLLLARNYRLLKRVCTSMRFMSTLIKIHTVCTSTKSIHPSAWNPPLWERCKNNWTQKNHRSCNFKFTRQHFTDAWAFPTRKTQPRIRMQAFLILMWSLWFVTLKDNTWFKNNLRSQPAKNSNEHVRAKHKTHKRALLSDLLTYASTACSLGDPQIQVIEGTLRLSNLLKQSRIWSDTN